MSFGRKVEAAVRALQAEGRLPSTLRPVERNARVIDKLMALGHISRHELPSRRTLGCYLDRAEPECPLCTSTNDAAGGISDVDDPSDDEGENSMEAAPQALAEITQCVRQWLLTVAHDHSLDQALHPNYLRGLATLNNRTLEPGDVIQLRPVDMSWFAELMVVSVVRAPPSVAAKLIRAPIFLMATADRSQVHIIAQLNDLQNQYSLGKVTQQEYERRSDLLQKLRDGGGCYPTPWIADKLSQLHRALDANLLTPAQHATAQKELLAALNEAQLIELNGLIGDKSEPVAAEAE